MVKRKVLAVLLCNILIAGSIIQNGSSTPSIAADLATIQIDAASNVHTIKPEIYGMAFADSAMLKELNIPLNRAGGNAMTHYNWQTDSSNRGSDWYFENIPEDNANPSLLPNGSMTDRFYETNRVNHANTMLTIPMTGYVSKDRVKRGSFSISKYGPQTDSDPWLPDAGNGTRVDGTKITNNNVSDNYKTVDSTFTSAWINHLVGNYKNAQNGGVKYYLLDNEPGLWTETHRDAVKTPKRDDEFINTSIEYAKAIKNADPTALVCGLEEWGWMSLRYSPYDWVQVMNGKPTEDMTLHGYSYFAEYYLKKMKEAEKLTGKRLLDVFTFHYYPQRGNILQNTRSLWDKDYTDPSWINEKINMIPRAKEWVQKNYPGTQIGITEYNFGSLDKPEGGIAQADVLGILGREGVDLANLWTTVPKDSPAYQAFKLYRNYDGKNSTFGDTSVGCTVPSPDVVSAFASTDSKTGEMKIIVLNKNANQAMPVNLKLSNFQAQGLAKVYQWAGTGSLAQQADATVSSGGVGLVLPPYSATLLVIAKGQAQVSPTPTLPQKPTPPVISPTPTKTPISTKGLRVEMYNEATSSNIQINPQFRMFNDSKTKINLADVKVRYYFTIDQEVKMEFGNWCSKGSIVTSKFVKMNPAKKDADYYLEIGFTSGSLNPGENIQLATWLNKNNWSTLNQANDYSFNKTTGFKSWNKCPAYLKGVLAWGTEP